MFVSKDLKVHELNEPDTLIVEGDCLKILPRLRDVEATCIFADPPFNKGENYGSVSDNMDAGKFTVFCIEWIMEIGKLAKDHTSVWVNVPDYMISFVYQQLCGQDLKLINWCIWHYRFAQKTNLKFIPAKTHCLWMCKKPELVKWRPENVQVETDRAKYYDDWRDDSTGTRVPFDVWGFEKYWGRVQGNNKERVPGRPNQLPEKYLERVIKACTDEGDLVIDPFLGTGTTTTVARALNRRSIGIELDPEAVKLAYERTEKGAVRI